jgi:hypothetical protein
MTARDADLLEEILSRLAARFATSTASPRVGKRPEHAALPGVAGQPGCAGPMDNVRIRPRPVSAIARTDSTTARCGSSMVGGPSCGKGSSQTARPFGRDRRSFRRRADYSVRFQPNALVDRATNLDDYVRLPGTLGLRFHVLVVDGRKRRRCLEEAASLLEEGGVAMLGVKRKRSSSSWIGFTKQVV